MNTVQLPFLGGLNSHFYIPHPSMIVYHQNYEARPFARVVPKCDLDAQMTSPYHLTSDKYSPMDCIVCPQYTTRLQFDYLVKTRNMEVNGDYEGVN